MMYTRNFLYKENYDITFRKAKTLPCYKCIRQAYSSNVQTIIDDDNVDNIPANNIPIIVQLGCINIQLTLINSFNHVEAGYLVWIRNSNGWSEYSYTGDNVVISDNLEEQMFHMLIQFATEECLTWSYPNNIECITKNQMGIEKCPYATIAYPINKISGVIHFSFCEVDEQNENLSLYTYSILHLANSNIPLTDLCEYDNSRYNLAIIRISGVREFVVGLTANEVYEYLKQLNIADFVNIFNSDSCVQ